MIRQQSHVHRDEENTSEKPRTESAGAGAGGPAHHMHEMFRHFAQKTSALVGTPWAFAIASLSIVIWAITGHLFHYSDTWQLVINTATTIVTFLMVFLIQNTQNRDARAIHLKLDELIRGVRGARNWLVDLENLTDEELDQIEKEFKRVREKAHHGGLKERPASRIADAHEKVKTIADSPSRS
jgi:low affinity Fe/Cu permease